MQVEVINNCTKKKIIIEKVQKKKYGISGVIAQLVWDPSFPCLTRTPHLFKRRINKEKF